MGSPTPISGQCLVWGCSAEGLKPASCPELIPALFLLWPAQPVPCQVQGSAAHVCQCWACCAPNRDGRWCLAAWSIPTTQPTHLEPPAFLPARTAARLMGIRGAQTLPQAGCSPIPNGSGRCFCYTSNPTGWLGSLWSAQRGKGSAPTAPGGAIAAARGCRKC